MQEEKKQIEQAKKNIKEFEPLYKLYHSKILRFCYQRVESKAMAYDLCSQTFLKAMKNLSKYEYRGVSFGAWLYRIASNEINTYHKKNQKIIKVDESFLELLSEEIEEKDEEGIKKLKKAILELKPIEIQLIQMRFWEERPFKEISEIVTLTEINAKTKTYRALEKLRTKLIKKQGR